MICNHCLIADYFVFYLWICVDIQIKQINALHDIREQYIEVVDQYSLCKFNKVILTFK